MLGRFGCPTWLLIVDTLYSLLSFSDTDLFSQLDTSIFPHSRRSGFLFCWCCFWAGLILWICYQDNKLDLTLEDPIQGHVESVSTKNTTLTENNNKEEGRLSKKRGLPKNAQQSFSDDDVWGNKSTFPGNWDLSVGLLVVSVFPS